MCMKKISFEKEKKKKEENIIYIRSLGYHYTHGLFHTVYFIAR